MSTTATDHTAGRPSRRTALQRARKPLTLVHVVASVGLLGASSSSLLLAVTAAATSDGELARSALRLISTQSAAFGIPLSFIALLSGIALGFGTRWGVLRYRWTTAKLVLLALVVLNGALVVLPTTASLLDGDGSAWLLAGALAVTDAMLLASVALSVYKPGGRRRRLRAAAR